MIDAECVVILVIMTVWECDVFVMYDVESCVFVLNDGWKVLMWFDCGKLLLCVMIWRVVKVARILCCNCIIVVDYV